MKIRINTHQLDLLTSNFVIVEGLGLQSNDTNLITESLKRWRIKMYVNGMECELDVGSSSSGTALAVVKNLFKSALVTGSAKQVK